MAGNQDVYGTYGSVSKTAPNAKSPTYQGMFATPEMFGAEQAKSLQDVGKELGKYAEDQVNSLAEADANSKFAKNYLPESLRLKQQYDEADPSRKSEAYTQYLTNMQSLNSKYINSIDNSRGREVLNSLINNTYRSEAMSASSALEASNKEYMIDSRYEAINALATQAGQNYNVPDAVEKSMIQAGGHVKLKNADIGNLDMNTPEVQGEIRYAKGLVAGSAIDAALKGGDIYSANNMYVKYGGLFNPDKDKYLTYTLNMENNRQNADRTIESWMSGKKAPAPSGFTTLDVQTTILDTAEHRNINPSHLLALAQMESSMGANLGNPSSGRATIGQTKGNPSMPVAMQAKDMADNWESAKKAAESLLGREATAAEIYTCYQQGNTGGCKLLEALMKNPNQKVLDVLVPAYAGSKDPYKMATLAIEKNGGNLNMTVRDFTGYIGDKYNSFLDSFSVTSVKDGVSLGKQLADVHEIQPPALQNYSNPVARFEDFRSKAPAILEAINSEPRNDIRAKLLSKYEQEATIRKQAADAYNDKNRSDVMRMMEDPSFLNVNQINSSLLADIKQNDPEFYFKMENKAKENREESSKATIVYDGSIGAQLSAIANTSSDPLSMIKGDDHTKIKKYFDDMSSDKQLSMIKDMASTSNDRSALKRAVTIFSGSGNGDDVGNPVGVAADIVASKSQNANKNVVARTILEGYKNYKEIQPKDGATIEANKLNVNSVFDEETKGMFVGDSVSYDSYKRAVTDYIWGNKIINHDTSTEITNDEVVTAVKSVIGDAPEYGGRKVLIPWGMTSDEFKMKADPMINNAAAEHLDGLGIKSSNVSLKPNKLVSGMYFLTSISGNIEVPFSDKKGNRIAIYVGDK